MALRFVRKKSADGADGKDVASFEADPEKAQQWFDHAKAMADSYSYDTALFYYANGVRLNPTKMSVHEAMYDAGVQHFKRGGKPATGKDVRTIDGAHPVEKFAAAEFAWLRDINNPALAIKFLEAAVNAEPWAGEVGRMHAGRVVNMLRRQKKPSKSAFLAAKDHMARLGAWDEAIAAADDALHLDPKDSGLEQELKDLSAQRAMDQGRYAEAAGEEGGFRKFVRDPDKQRELEEAERISGGMSIDDRNLDRARKEYEQSPGIPDVINAYGQLLKAKGTPEAMEKAHGIFMKGYQDTRQYRFRATAGDIRIEQATARLDELRQKAESGGGNSALKSAYDDARRALFDLRLAELEARVREYPTDRKLKFQLGETHFEMGRYDEAMRCFQESKDEPKLRARAAWLLGRCFAAESWHDIAVQEYKEALERAEPGDKDMELAIRYDLMLSLIELARQEKSLDLAKEALEICSSIARKDITYRDIRLHRKQVDELVKQLGTAPPGA